VGWRGFICKTAILPAIPTGIASPMSVVRQLTANNIDHVFQICAHTVTNLMWELPTPFASLRIHKPWSLVVIAPIYLPWMWKIY
jgi:hypothetical protein